MNQNIPNDEQHRRLQLVNAAKTMILNALPIEDENESGLTMAYEGFYLQIDFAYLHPLMVVSFLRKLEPKPGAAVMKLANHLNRNSLIGCHTIDTDAGIYSYRAAHWLDTELTKGRFLEMLDRCFGEAAWAYGQIHRPQ